VRKQVNWPLYLEGDGAAQAAAEEWCRHGHMMPNVRAKLPAEAGFVSPVRDDSTTGADRAYKACRSGSA
jgi:hypothetical protein